jgi:ankyrin repeat protein
MRLHTFHFLLLLAAATLNLRCSQPAMKQADPLLHQTPADYYAGPALDMAQAIRSRDHAGLESLCRSHPASASSTGLSGLPLLVWAMRHNDPASTEILLKAGASVDVTFPYGNWRMSAVSLAAGMENPLFLDLLLAWRANPAGLPDTEPPLFTAIKNSRTDHLPVLIKAGANLDQQDSAGKTAVHIAALAGDWKTALALVNMGANPRASLKNGVTLNTLIEKFPLAASHPQHAAQADLSARLR